MPSGPVALLLSRLLGVRNTVVLRKWMVWILSVLRVCTSGRDSLVSSEVPRLHFSDKNFPNASAFSRLVIKSSPLLFHSIRICEQGHAKTCF